jgi:alpha-mannosidase
VLTPDGAASQAAAPADPAEPVQPVFTRYWLHGKGPAPAGNLPVAVHLSPARTALAGPGSAAALRLTVACGPAAASGTVRLDGGGLALDPAGPLEYDLGPRGHARWDVTAAVLPGPQGQPGTGPGRYFVTARTAGDDGQVFEDAVLVSVGEPPPPRLDLPLDELIPLYQADTEALAAEVDLQLLTRELVLRPGEAGEITATLRNGTASPPRGAAQLVSPFGSWAGGQPWTQAFAADAGAQVTLTFQVTQPAAARGGQHWWALVKVMYFGRARYTDPVAVRIATE